MRSKVVLAQHRHLLSHDTFYLKKELKSTFFYRDIFFGDGHGARYIVAILVGTPLVLPGNFDRKSSSGYRYPNKKHEKSPVSNCVWAFRNRDELLY